MCPDVPGPIFPISEAAPQLPPSCLDFGPAASAVQTVRQATSRLRAATATTTLERRSEGICRDTPPGATDISEVGRGRTQWAAIGPMCHREGSDSVGGDGGAVEFGAEVKRELCGDSNNNSAAMAGGFLQSQGWAEPRASCPCMAGDRRVRSAQIPLPYTIPSNPIASDPTNPPLSPQSCPKPPYPVVPTSPDGKWPVRNLNGMT
jgi:hypothetical protein